MKRLLGMAIGGMFALLPLFAQFQQYPGPGPSQDPNADTQEQTDDIQHGVARLSIAQGDVSVKRGDNGELSAAVPNVPLMARDHLETAPGSRAEIEMDAGNFLRLGPNTDIGFASLDSQHTQIQLGVGALILRSNRQPQTEIELDTPSVSFRPAGVGEYRIAVFDNGTTQVSVRSGALEMTGPRGSQTLSQGQTFLVRGDASDPEYQTASESPRDQLDDWSAGRDNELQSSQSAQFVGPDIPGAQDLDRYGNWVPSQYGQVWAPQNQATDWSPYSTGQWNYLDYYGWTWVDSAPWGWAPFHYGRWFWNGGSGWCWWPGGRGLHNRWSPAQVSFFGYGGGRGYGWVALAPFETFHAWWGPRGRSYSGFGYAGGLSQGYRNASIRGGAITASFGAFGGAGRRYSIATRGQINEANVFRGGIPIGPTSNAYRFSERTPAYNSRVSGAANRQFFSTQRFNSNSNSARPSAGGNGWQRFGSPGGPSTRQGFNPAPQSQYAPRRPESGWHSFGETQAPSRPSPSYSGRGGSNSGGGSSYRAPSYNSAPQRSAPPQQHFNYGNGSSSAPRQNYGRPEPSNRGGGGGGYSRGGGGGGGGGASHSGGGGGGGGNHSGGGGGGRHR